MTGRDRKRLRVIIVGAGRVTLELLRGLSDIWHVAVVDPDPEALARAEKVRDIVAIDGDGSSRVVLDLCHLDRADALVAATDDDAVNLEACRLAREAGVARIAAVAADPELLSDYRAAEVAAVAPDLLAARRVEINLEPGRLSSVTFAEGKAEAVELLITDDSPPLGRTLAELHSDRWLVAAILREGQVLVPHGGNRLQVGDLVTVVGAATDHGLIVRSFVSGGGRFPAGYGRQVAVAVETAEDGARVVEAVQLTRNSAAEAVLLVHRDASAISDDERRRRLDEMLVEINEAAGGVEVRQRPVDGAPRKALAGVAAEESVGVVVLPRPPTGPIGSRVRVPESLRLAAEMGVPVLFASGRAAYRHVAVALEDAVGAVAAARAAIDLAAVADADLTAVAALPPGPRTQRALPRAVRAAERVRIEADAVGVRVRRLVRRGGLAKVLEEATHADLIVMAMPATTPSLLQPTVAGQLMRKSEASLLLVPPPR